MHSVNERKKDEEAIVEVLSGGYRYKADEK